MKIDEMKRLYGKQESTQIPDPCIVPHTQIRLLPARTVPRIRVANGWIQQQMEDGCFILRRDPDYRLGSVGTE